MLRRRIGFSAIGIGYAGVLVLEAALAHAGAGHAVAYGVFVAATGAFDLRPGECRVGGCRGLGDQRLNILNRPGLIVSGVSAGC